MREQHPKEIILAAFQDQGDFSRLAGLGKLRSAESSRLLHWLDQSGIALSLLHRLETCGVAGLLPADLHDELRQRLSRNKVRLRDMLENFERVNEAFQLHKVHAVTLKGFGLVPDFCEDACLRHQSDFDFLVAPEQVEAAAESLGYCGYSTARLSKSGESCFSTPLTHVPSEHDDLYAIQAHRQVDLHTSITESYSWLSFEVPGDCMAHAEPATLCGVEFFRLGLADRFLVQVLHVFRHCFRSWARLSWLFEIGRCMELHFDNRALGERVVARAGESLLTKRAFALVLGLIERLLQKALPYVLTRWANDSLTVSMRAWLDNFSVEWAIADWPGSLSNLFLAEDFISDRAERSKYLRSRLIPRNEQATIGTVTRNARDFSLRMRSAQAQYLVRRSSAHLRDILTLPLQEFRWRRALDGARTGVPRRDLESPVGHGGV